MDLPAVPGSTALPKLAADATLPPARHRGQATALPVNPPAANVPVPSSASNVAATAPSPPALPSAFNQTNIYTFGAPPANNYAESTQVPQIFFAQVQPTVITNGQPITISAVTTSNVATLSLGTSPIAPVASVVNIGPGKWQTTFNVNSDSLPSTHGNISLLLTATTATGGHVSLPIPFSLHAP